MNHLTARQERKRQPAQSHDRCDRARTMCGALASNVRSSTPWHRCAQRRKFGVSEIRNFHHIVNTKNILHRMDPPVLSSPVLSCGHAPFGQMSESKRTECGQNADTNRTGALRTRFGLKLGISRRRRPRAGHLSRASACGHAWTSVRTDADRMRTKSGQMSASKRTKCGQKADEKRTRRQPISMDGRPSARMHAAMTAPVVSLSPRR
jgi:hypothetical protein